MKPWKPEYVELLRQNIEELKHVKFIDNRGRDEDPVSKSPSSKESGFNTKVKDVNKKNKNSVKSGKNKRMGHFRLFKPEEDAILMSAKVKSSVDVMDLARQLKRNPQTIKNRIKKLEFTGTSTRNNKSITLEEDLLIIDAAIQILVEKKEKLAQLSLNFNDLGISLVRHPDSVYKRWERNLRVWLLGFYSKTLNLDIRIMLANVLADNFQDIDSIDWEYVKTFIEFKGHTVRSLRFTFFDSLLRQAAINLEIDKTELSLQQIAENAKICYSKENARKISEPVKIRQMKVIEYFESQAKKFNRKYFL